MNFFILEDQWIEQINLEKVLNSIAKEQQIAVATIKAYATVDELLPATYRYQAAALDFISKGTANITERLRQDIVLVNQKIKQIKQLNQPTILLKIGTGYTRIALADILYFAPTPATRTSHFST